MGNFDLNMFFRNFPNWSSMSRLQNKNQTVRTFHRRNNTVFGNGPKDIFDWSKIWLDFFTFSFIFLQNHVANWIVLADFDHTSNLSRLGPFLKNFWRTWVLFVGPLIPLFIMIRKFVPVNNTDFWWLISVVF